MEFFKEDKKTALEAKEHAQFIAFAPVVFQASRVLRDSGILDIVESAHEVGLTEQEIVEAVKIPSYGVRVLLEAGLGIGLLKLNGDHFQATKTGYFILHDELTRANMDFVQDVCYRGMFHLDESLANGKPEGLKVFGNWKTIYEGLSQLPPNIQRSWFAFDHFYSDTAFHDVLPHIFSNNPKNIIDTGGNTGKWAIEFARYSSDVRITILDLPGQLTMAKSEVSKAGFSDRIFFHDVDILDPAQAIPNGFDMIWMSQFLDCFSEKEIMSIVQRCHNVLNEDGTLLILEAFWDRQKYKVSAFILQQTSLYFSAMANGNSQMYHSKNFIRCIEEAGFDVVSQVDLIGLSHTLLTCKAKK